MTTTESVSGRDYRLADEAAAHAVDAAADPVDGQRQPDAPRRAADWQSDWQLYRRLLAYVVPLWPLFLAAIVGFLLGNAGELWLARLVADVLETWGSPPANAALLFPALIMAAATLRGLGSVGGELFLGRISYHVVHRIRTQLFDQLLTIPAAYFDRSTQGHLVSRITFNVAQLRDTCSDALKTIVQDGTKVIMFLGGMLYTSWRLTLIFIAITPIVALITRYASRRFRRISERIQGSMGDVTHVASEAVNGHRAIRVYAGQGYEKRRFDRASDRNRRQNLKMILTKASNVQIIQLIVAAALSLIIALLYNPALSGGMSSGEVIFFITLAGLLAKPVKKLSEVNAKLQRGLAAAEDVFAQFDHPVERNAGRRRIDRARGRIEFRDVSFGYESGTQTVLDSISFAVEPGQTVALVGRSGGGKSTIINLIPRFYDALDGVVLLDDVPIEEYELGNLREQIAFVNQQVVLFNDTLRKNIAYGQLEDHSDAELAEAIRRAHADGFIEDLPEGLETLLGDSGKRLSGGQRQRIAIARALLKNAPVLILDEATSALDNESERHIQAALEEVMRDRTTIVIAHRLSTIERADLILVVEAGRIVESGSHETLLAQSGSYARLYASELVVTD
ncbi:MAG: lipid A export permease/ATP-binding protein MsbA [Pseudomonadota bacterium]